MAATLAARGAQYNGYPNSADYFGSFCFDALAIALHACFWCTDFDSALLRTVNHLGDADTTGAIAGQIAGAFYGHRGIPADHIERMRRWDDGEIELRAALLRGLEEYCRSSSCP